MSPKSTTKKEETPAITKRRELAGVAVKKSGDKTVAVEVARVTMHPIYGKRQTRTKTYLAHDATNEVEIGSNVTIRESRPLSRRKRWTVVDTSSTEDKAAS